MKKFSQVNEGKVFIADPSIIKSYAAYIIPLYLNGALKCDQKLIDEWLEANKSSNKARMANFLLDIELMAVKAVLENPTTQGGYESLKKEIASKCPKLERFLRQYYSNPDNIK